MGFEAKTKQIGDHTYQVTQLPGKLGRKILMRLMRVAAPLIDGAAKPTTEMFTSVAAALDDELVDFVESSFIGVTMISTDSGGLVPLGDRFNTHFAGKYQDWFQWVVFCLEVNYSDFLGELKRHIAKRTAQKEASPSISRPVLTGSSGA